MMTFGFKWGFGNVYIIDIFPCNVNVCLCVCVSFALLFQKKCSPSATSPITPLLHHLLSSSLAFISGLVEFPGRLWKKQSEFRAPTFTTHPWPLPLLPSSPCSEQSRHMLFFFFFLSDCNASVHKSCRDSLPICAKVKMKVKVPRE